MKQIVQKILTGERALFGQKDTEIVYCTFADGESPLKESRNILLRGSLFRWKYPLWYSRDIVLRGCTLFDTARAGIWYTENISLSDTTIDAPKTFRRTKNITMNSVTMPNASETLWNCDEIVMENVTARGDYFAMNSTGIRAENFNLTGNYSFDGCRDVEIRNAKILSKDCFWNCENVTVYDSFISGEYVGWNAKNVTFVNCVIESLQGMCYMDGVTLRNCRLINTTLAFEYSVVDAEVRGSIDSVFNPDGGYITADRIDELTMNPARIDPARTEISADIGKLSEK